MFKFGFNKDNEDDAEEVKEEPTLEWYPSRKIEIPSNVKELIDQIPQDHRMEVTYGGDCKITTLSSVEVMKKLREMSSGTLHSVLEADSQHSDLVAGKYEGGLKVWECTKDLADYFIENVSEEGLKSRSVLDLGCGSGHLGIVGLKYGAAVTFQDYNEEVIEHLTIPNVGLNLDLTDGQSNMEFYSGDWASFLLNLNQETEEIPAKKFKRDLGRKYDFILSSETIYNKENYKKIYEILKKLLKKDGTALIAAKTYYFGVGGSTSEFKKFVEHEKLFECKVCWKTSEGVVREILEVKFK